MKAVRQRTDLLKNRFETFPLSAQRVILTICNHEVTLTLVTGGRDDRLGQYTACLPAS